MYCLVQSAVRVHNSSDAESIGLAILWELNHSAYARGFHARCLRKCERLVPYPMNRGICEYSSFHRLRVESICGCKFHHDGFVSQSHQELFVCGPVGIENNGRSRRAQKLPECAENNRILPSASAQSVMAGHLTISWHERKGMHNAVSGKVLRRPHTVGKREGLFAHGRFSEKFRKGPIPLRIG